MSQHIFLTTHPEHGKLEVLAGWDRPLQGFFMHIEKLEAPEGEDGAVPYLYDNLDDDKLPLGGLSRSFDYFLPILKQHGIEVPAAMIEDIKADGAVNMGNKVRRWGFA